MVNHWILGFTFFFRRTYEFVWIYMDFTRLCATAFFVTMQEHAKIGSILLSDKLI